MNTQIVEKLEAAWRRIDERIANIQLRHKQRGDVPAYEAYAGPPATDKEIEAFESVIGMAVPFELAYSWKRWNGRWIAPDHEIALSDVQGCLSLARSAPRFDPKNLLTWERVVGPINPLMDSTKRLSFGSHQTMGSSLYFDFEDPPAGGRLGQVIRAGEEPVAEYVAASFVDFLNLIADVPVYDDDPDFDPLKSRP